MKTTIGGLVAGFCLGLLAVSAWADYGVIDKGAWPSDWPAELEPLRKQARTLVGPMVENRHFAIRMNKREEFEAAWPHLLRVKTKGAPIILARGPNFFLGDDRTEKKPIAGVVVHCPPEEPATKTGTAEAPVARPANAEIDWRNIIYLELVVDVEIVDLNRIPLPADTPIIDRRFSKTESPAKK